MLSTKKETPVKYNGSWLEGFIMTWQLFFLIGIVCACLLGSLVIEAVLVAVIVGLYILIYIVYGLKRKKNKYISNKKEMRHINLATLIFALMSLVYLFIRINRYGLSDMYYSFCQTALLFIVLMPMDFLIPVLHKKSEMNPIYFNRKYLHTQAFNLGLIIAILYTTLNGMAFLLMYQILLIKIISDIAKLLINRVSIADMDMPESTEQLNIKDIIEVISVGVFIAILILAAYKIGLYAGRITTAITMSFYVLLVSKWFVDIRSRIKGNRIKLLSVLLNIVFVAVQCLFLFIPVLRENFNIVQLSKYNWSQMILLLLWIIGYMIALITIKYIRKRKLANRNQ